MIAFASSYNFTNVTSQSHYQNWRMAATILIKLFIAIDGYLFLTLAVFELRVGVKNKKGRRNLRIKTDHVADLMRRLCLLASLLIFFRSITELVEVYKGQTSDFYCNATRYSKIVLHCGAITSLYFVLWLRQRQFYKLPAFEHLLSPATRCFSGAVAFFMAAASAIAITLFIAARGYKSSEMGCVVAWSSVWLKLPQLLLFIFTTTFQVILLSLLLHPLLKNRGSTGSKGKQRKQVVRVSIAALVAISTTIIVSLVLLFLSTWLHGLIQQLVVNLDTLVVFFSILFSFVDWKSRLFSFFVKNKRIISTLRIHHKNVKKWGDLERK